MIAADTTVVVAAALEWHASHHVAMRALRGRSVSLPQNTVIESYSVLTRLPEPQRLAPDIAWAYIRSAFESPYLALESHQIEEVLNTLSESAIGGGRIYDAIIGATALQARAVLWTLDERAVPTYELLGVRFEVLA